MTDDSTYIAILSGVPRCEGSSSLRWSWGRQLPCLSATTSSAEAKRRTGYIAALSRMLTESRRRQPTPSWDGTDRTGSQPHVSFETWSGFWPRPSRSQLVSARKLCSGDALRPDLPWVLNYTVLSVSSKGHLQFTGLQGAERGPQCLLGPLQFAGLHFCTEKHHDQRNMP